MVPTEYPATAKWSLCQQLLGGMFTVLTPGLPGRARERRVYSGRASGVYCPRHPDGQRTPEKAHPREMEAGKKETVNGA